MENWYSVRCIFYFPERSKGSEQFLYEERILLWKTESIDEAIKLAEQEAENYSKENECRYLGLAQAYQTYLDEPKSGSEVFALMRDSNFEYEEYLDNYFDTGDERQKV